MQWVNTFGGIFDDRASYVEIANDGNLIVSGSISQVATFSDGGQLGTTDTPNDVPKSIVLKLNSNTGELIWKTYIGNTINRYGSGYPTDNSVIIQSDGSIILLNNSWYYNTDNK